jgi:hypothetical protein
VPEYRRLFLRALAKNLAKTMASGDSSGGLRMNDSLDDLFSALAKSPFRRRFRLRGRELEYLQQKSLPVVLEHAADFIEKRLAPANPVNDGKQTPMRHHPVFIAQHATGTCCRGCLLKWHRIPKGRELTRDEKLYVVEVIKEWLVRQEREA